jgi:hypothetical protein
VVDIDAQVIWIDLHIDVVINLRHYLDESEGGMAAMGGILKVIGRRIEMVATGPIPGKTPINVPSRTPAKQ